MTFGEQNSDSIVTAVEISPPTPKPTIARKKHSTAKLGASAHFRACAVCAPRINLMNSR
jgi:hypothetical protein